ncbi:HEAT repeat domain-containing protein [Lusitaniella coriacea LEGE 07157]|uniref:HEAT repeat domain-containing protein n=1 Tax=Lusitaniella coriacea LEGE 07157 TaxID=945747 RepID=A0A8J7DX69_9CYAN|nr:sister chromatid cohesion protein PDS5 [Lusitaniella coriacea]MBE9116919.1 HEAT repeat domain-containing protein [Lusitaniella coriacea LEGE 07157]
MGFIWGILGLIVGAGVTFWLLQQKIADKARENASNLDRLRSELEKAHEARLQDTIRSLQTDYEQQLQNRENAIRQSYEAELQGKIALIQVGKQQELERAIANMQPVPQSSEPEAPTESRQLEVPTEMLAQLHATEVEEETPTLQKESPVDSQLTESVEEIFISQEKSLVDSSRAPEKVEETPVVQTIAAIPEPKAVVLEKQKEQPLSPRVLPFGRSFPDRALTTKLQNITSVLQLNASIHDRDKQVRAQIASTLGELAKTPLVKRELERTLQILGKLCRDSSAIVRYEAVKALGQIESDRAIVPLQQALRDVDRNVVKAASLALSRFKFYPVKRQKILPSNGVWKGASHES